MTTGSQIPVIDISSLASGLTGDGDVADKIGEACRTSGFFYIVGHGVDATLQHRLEELSRQFFARPAKEKLDIRMELGGRAWRGYFPVGNELTSGRPDQKEGLYFGAELGDDHPAVQAGVPMYGRNLFPDIDGFRETVLDYLDAMTRLGHVMMRGIALSLGLSESYFHDRYTADPLILFRIFHYPPLPASKTDPQNWSVGEHTDYGLLTILRQDAAGGLQVKSQSRWIDASPIPDSFVCNIGDMLDRMTGGRYRSTPHRVRNTSVKGRLSFPFFFDPNVGAAIQPVPDGNSPIDDSSSRWDRSNVHTFKGTYGEYILGKIANVFPDLIGESYQSGAGFPGGDIGKLKQ